MRVKVQHFWMAKLVTNEKKEVLACEPPRQCPESPDREGSGNDGPCRVPKAHWIASGPPQRSGRQADRSRHAVWEASQIDPQAEEQERTLATI